MIRFMEPVEGKLRPDWPAEIKFDGTGVFASQSGLLNKRGNWIQHRYPEFAPSQIPPQSILVGEVCVLNSKGVSDFQLLSYRDRVDDEWKIRERAKKWPATLFLYDIVMLRGRDLRQKSFMERRRVLENEIQERDWLRISPLFSDPHWIWRKVVENDLEGVVQKHPQSLYRGGKQRTWIKVKNWKHISQIWILGYTVGKGSRSGTLGAIIIGEKQGRKWIERGKVGTGFSDHELDVFSHLLQAPGHWERNQYWLEHPVPLPSGYHVQYLSIGVHGHYRFPSLKRR